MARGLPGLGACSLPLSGAALGRACRSQGPTWWHLFLRPQDFPRGCPCAPVLVSKHRAGSGVQGGRGVQGGGGQGGSTACSGQTRRWGVASWVSGLWPGPPIAGCGCLAGWMPAQTRGCSLPPRGPCPGGVRAHHASSTTAMSSGGPRPVPVGSGCPRRRRGEKDGVGVGVLGARGTAGEAACLGWHQPRFNPSTPTPQPAVSPGHISTTAVPSPCPVLLSHKPGSNPSGPGDHQLPPRALWGHSHPSFAGPSLATAADIPKAPCRCGVSADPRALPG